MATFLELVNSINQRFNEVTLTAGQFSSALGHYAQTRDAVNAAHNEIYSEQYEWPFLRVKQAETLVPYQTRYNFPSDYKYVDIETFRIRYDAALGNDARRLIPISYDDFIQNFSAQESLPNDSLSGLPTYVFHGASQEWGVSYKPDKAYVVDYEYIKQPAELVNAADVSVVPDAYKYVVLFGAEYYVHMFRDNMESASRAEEKFKKGIKDMRKVLINRNDNVRSTAVPSSGYVRGRYI
jgi:hypothetical protein